MTSIVQTGTTPTAPAAFVAPASAGGFNYGALPEETAAELRAAATRIRAAQRNALVEVGLHLLAAKRILAHGKFSNWAAAELGMTLRTAELIMAAAQFLEGKPKSISDLPVTVLYRLAAPSAPPDIVGEVVETAEAGAPLDPKAIANRLKEAASARREAERAARLKAQEHERRQRRLQQKGMPPEEAERRAAELAARDRRREEREREREAREEEARRRRLAPLAEAMVAALSGAERDAVKHVLADYGSRDRRALLDLIEARLAAPTAAEGPQ